MKINYRASATFRRVHKSNELVKAIRGPIGSGKSVGCVMEMFRICLNQEPNSDGVRRTRWACVRNTYPGFLKVFVRLNTTVRFLE